MNYVGKEEGHAQKQIMIAKIKFDSVLILAPPQVIYLFFAGTTVPLSMLQIQ